MMHVAVVHRRYAEALLSGRKTIESRLSRSRREPFGRVRRGDRVFFKVSGGPYAAVATVWKVRMFEGLDAAGVARLRAEFGSAIGGDAGYWASKADATYATLIWVRGVREVADGPRIPPLNGRGWLCLPGDAGGIEHEGSGR